MNPPHPLKTLSFMTLVMNAPIVLGVWRIFSDAVNSGSALVVPDLGMPLEVRVVFPAVFCWDLIFFSALLLDWPAKIGKKVKFS